MKWIATKQRESLVADAIFRRFCFYRAEVVLQAKYVIDEIESHPCKTCVFYVCSLRHRGGREGRVSEVWIGPQLGDPQTVPGSRRTRNWKGRQSFDFL